MGSQTFTTLKDEYDIIICGSGSAGSAAAGILAERSDLEILLLEAGGDDDDPRVENPERWPENLGTDRDWGWITEPNSALDGRRTFSSMGRGLGGGSSINVATWARGHRADWDRYAQQTSDPSWNYQSTLAAYCRIEDYQGAADPERRGIAGPMWISQVDELHPMFEATLVGAQGAGLTRFASPNGVMAELGDGCAQRDETIHDGHRQSVYRSYVAPQLHRSNLTVATRTQVMRVVIKEGRATGVEVFADGRVQTIRSEQVVLSLGAVQTPTVLMRSGLGPAAHLRNVGIDVLADLPGVGANLDDHVQFGCVWEAADQPLPATAVGRAVCFWGQQSAEQGPPFVMYQGAGAFVSPEVQAAHPMPEKAITFLLGMRLSSRGSVRLTGPQPTDRVLIDNAYFAEPTDLDRAVEAFALIREIAESPAMRPFCRRLVAPFSTDAAGIAGYIRQAALTYWHQCGTAKMGTDSMSVVDGRLAVHGIAGLRIADASVLPRVTSGNTMAPSVVIGDHVAQIILMGSAEAAVADQAQTDPAGADFAGQRR